MPGYDGTAGLPARASSTLNNLLLFPSTLFNIAGHVLTYFSKIRILQLSDTWQLLRLRHGYAIIGKGRANPLGCIGRGSLFRDIAWNAAVLAEQPSYYFWPTGTCFQHLLLPKSDNTPASLTHGYI